MLNSAVSICLQLLSVSLSWSRTGTARKRPCEATGTHQKRKERIRKKVQGGRRRVEGQGRREEKREGRRNPQPFSRPLSRAPRAPRLSNKLSEVGHDVERNYDEQGERRERAATRESREEGGDNREQRGEVRVDMSPLLSHGDSPRKKMPAAATPVRAAAPAAITQPGSPPLPPLPSPAARATREKESARVPTRRDARLPLARVASETRVGAARTGKRRSDSTASRCMTMAASVYVLYHLS